MARRQDSVWSRLGCVGLISIQAVRTWLPGRVAYGWVVGTLAERAVLHNGAVEKRSNRLI